MADIIDQLKARARILHREALAGGATALARLRRVPSLKSLPSDTLVASLKRRHCLTAVANELGFSTWSNAVRALRGSASADFGSVLYPPGVHGHWNIWCASYAEAKPIRRAHGGYLLTYRHQFLVVDADYVDAMGLDRDDPDWDLIGRDWARPDEPAARRRLCEKLVRRRLNDLAAAS